MNIEDLKAGDTFYVVEGLRFQKIEYLCLFPFHNPVNLGSYHIVIDKLNDEPIRVYKDTLKRWLENSFETRPEALKKQMNNELAKMIQMRAFHESELDDYKDDVTDCNGVKVSKGDTVSYEGHTYEVLEDEVMLYIKTDLQRVVLRNVRHLITIVCTNP